MDLLKPNMTFYCTSKTAAVRFVDDLLSRSEDFMWIMITKLESSGGYCVTSATFELSADTENRDYLRAQEDTSEDPLQILLPL
jgi:hypothetical protein